MDTADNLVIRINHQDPITINLLTQRNPFLFSLEETSYLKIRANLSAGCSLAIEAYQVKQGERLMDNLKGIFVLDSGIEYLFSGGDLYYFPGRYKVIYTKGALTREFYFQVTFRHTITEEGYYRILSRIQSLLHDIVFNLNRKGVMRTDSESLPALSNNLERERRNFRNLLSHLLFSLDSELKTDYVPSSLPRKVDGKAIRKNLLHPKGKDASYARKKVLSYDTKENQNLKKRIQEAKKEFFLTYVLVEQRKKGMSMSSDMEENASAAMRLFHEKARKEKENNLLFLTELEKLLSEYLFLCNRFLNDERVKTISEIPILSFGGQNDALLKQKLDSIFEKKSDFVYKSSPKLFEYYGYYLLHKALEKDGYHLLQPESVDFLSFKENETFLCYENEERLITLLYGPFCKYFLQTEEKDVTVSINSKHKSPDFLLGVYDKKSGKLLFENVLEIKYIPLERFDNTPESEKDMISTFADYLQLGYLSKEEGLCTGVIRRVVALFLSREDTMIDYQNLHRIYLLGTDGLKDERMIELLQHLVIN